MHEVMVTSSRSKVDPSGVTQLAVHRTDDVGREDWRQAIGSPQVRA
jgi:hypothetical protein